MRLTLSLFSLDSILILIPSIPPLHYLLTPCVTVSMYVLLPTGFDGRHHPLALVQGGLRRRDVDKRLTIAFNCQNSLEEFVESSPKAQSVGETLTDKARQVTDWMDCLVPLLQPDTRVEYALSMDSGSVSKLVKVLPNDCMNAILVDIGRQIWEDHLLTRPKVAMVAVCCSTGCVVQLGQNIANNIDIH